MCRLCASYLNKFEKFFYDVEILETRVTWTLKELLILQNNVQWKGFHEWSRSWVTSKIRYRMLNSWLRIFLCHSQLLEPLTLIKWNLRTCWSWYRLMAILWWQIRIVSCKCFEKCYTTEHTIQFQRKCFHQFWSILCLLAQP